MQDFQEHLMKTNQVCEMLAVERRRVYLLRDKGILVPIKIGKADAYRYSAILAFIDANMGKDLSGIEDMTPKGAQALYGRFC